MSQLNSPSGFLAFIPKRLGIFSPNSTRSLYVPIYARLHVFVQLSATLTTLCLGSAWTRWGSPLRFPDLQLNLRGRGQDKGRARGKDRTRDIEGKGTKEWGEGQGTREGEGKGEKECRSHCHFQKSELLCLQAWHDSTTYKPHEIDRPAKTQRSRLSETSTWLYRPSNKTRADDRKLSPNSGQGCGWDKINQLII